MFLVPQRAAAANAPPPPPQPAAAGPVPDFATIVREHQAMVYSIAWHMLRNHGQAEELAQDVFLQLHRNLGTIESAAHLTNWLRRVATQRAIDALRRGRLRRPVALEDTAELPAAGAAQNGDPLLSDRLDRMIDELPERARAIVLLRYQEEMEPGEIAATLGIPVGTVKSNLHRSLALLRGRLERRRELRMGRDK